MQKAKKLRGERYEKKSGSVVADRLANGKTFYGVGTPIRGSTALPLFIDYLNFIDLMI